MTGVYIEYSASNMEVLHRYVLQLTRKRAKVYTSPFPVYSLVLIKVHDSDVCLFQGRNIKEGTVPISLPEAFTYIREQIFIQSLEN